VRIIIQPAADQLRKTVAGNHFSQQLLHVARVQQIIVTIQETPLILVKKLLVIEMTVDVDTIYPMEIKKFGM